MNAKRAIIGVIVIVVLLGAGYIVYQQFLAPQPETETVENVVDPSAGVSKDFRMTIVLLKNGQVLNGLVVSKNEKTLTLQTQTDKRVIGLGDVDELRPTTLSPMPDGLLDNLSPRQIRSLFDYLKQPAQVPLPENAE